MGGFENYGADDLYNMEDVWNEKPLKHKVKYAGDRHAVIVVRAL